eukprot:TRINITY_DN58057_c0_g1_i1.p1 TRINITY_DN58057_c0_g1~~TRINITY_DN58057_c0_g1_i1.p1  ORF type:complete len:446 (+),score=109.83 TRINITY_DN58057_c0_g1_i1:124-1461(+)
MPSLLTAHAGSQPTAVRQALVGALIAEGLPETAACLREEANLGDLPATSADASLQALLENGLMKPDAAAALEKALHGNHADLPPPPDSHAILPQAEERMMQQKESLEKLHDKLRALRSDGDTSNGDDSHTDHDAVGAELEAELARQDAEVARLKRQLEDQLRMEADMDRRLKQARDEVQVLRAMRTHSAREAPAPAAEKDVDKIKRILLQWESPAGPRRSATHCFAKVDTNHDGKLKWNNDEIRSFVRLIFKHYQVPLPTWQDPVWYELYRRCDVDQSYSLDLEESFKFARVCFETALHQAGESLSNPLAPAAVATISVQSGASMSSSHGRSPAAASAVNVKDVIENALTDCDHAGRLRDRCVEKFQQADADGDRRLSHQPDEIRPFVGLVFATYGLQLPAWADLVWNELYRACEIEQMVALTFEQAYNLSKHCLELRGYEADSL